MPNAQCLLPFNLQRMKPYIFLSILSSLGYTRQATTMQKAFQRLLAIFRVLILALADTLWAASHQCCSAKKSVPELRLGLVLSIWHSTLPGVDFVGFPYRLGTCLGPTSHPRCDFSKPQMSATHGTYRGV